MGQNRKKLWLSGACLLLCALLAARGTFAWLSKEQPVDDAYVALSDFEVEGVLTFGNQAPQTGSSVLIPVSLTPGAANYIGDMKYVVRYTGVSPALVRVRVLEQWIDPTANEIVPMGYLKYHVTGVTRPGEPAPKKSVPAAGSRMAALAEGGGWVDNRDRDYCYYYRVPVQPKDLSTPENSDTVTLGDGTVELTLIDQPDGNTTAAMIEGIAPSVQLMLLIEVEAVQPNRYREFWHMDALPEGVG